MSSNQKQYKQNNYLKLVFSLLLFNAGAVALFVILIIAEVQLFPKSSFLDPIMIYPYLGILNLGFLVFRVIRHK